VCHGAILKSDTFTIDFTNQQDARKKALWFPADKLNIAKQGLGWKGDGACSYDGWIQTKPIALGLSWRPPSAVNIRIMILPPPTAILLNDGNMSTPYPGNVFVRYSPDLKNWSSWIILEHSNQKSSDEKKRNERCYEGSISVTQRSRNKYFKLLDNYSKLDVPWKSDEEAAVRWILKRQPNFFSKNRPFIGYIEFLFESNFHGGQRIKSFKADLSYCINGRHYPPSNTNIYNKRDAIPWRFKASDKNVEENTKNKHVFKYKIHPDLKLMTFVLYDCPKNKFEIEKIEIYSKNVSTPFQIIGRYWAPLPLFKKERRLEALDMNFDGYKDIRLMQEQGATGNIRYHVWLYNPKTRRFDYHQEYGDLCSFSYDPKTKVISTFSKGGHKSNIHSSETYKIINDKLTMVTKYKQEYNRKDDNYLYTLWKRVDGKMKIVKHGVVPDKNLFH